jgi:hypothetical protein
MKTDNKTYDVTLDGHTYRGVTIEMMSYAQPGAGAALVLNTTEDGYPERLATASVNVSAYGAMPNEGCIFVKDYEEGSGMLKFLEEAKIAEPTGRVVEGGYVSFHEARFVGEWAELELAQRIETNAERARRVGDVR